MSQDLSDYVYLDAKERAYEIEIEARKEYESKKDDLVDKKTKKLEDEFKKKIEVKEVQKRMYCLVTS
jgi:vacuolar-type H+-ATPase subunit H